MKEIVIQETGNIEVVENAINHLFSDVWDKLPKELKAKYRVPKGNYAGYGSLSLKRKFEILSELGSVSVNVDIKIELD
ncbi:MAG: hypothetical protein AAF599_00115 [Bacteroidota bacterium]